MKKLLISLAVASSGLTAQAQIRLAQPSYGGSGCPAGSASVVVSPDSSVMQILLDEMVAETGATLKRWIDRKQCTIILPVISEPGYQYTILFGRTAGFVSLEPGAQATVSQTLRIPNGSKNQILEKKWIGPISSDFILDNGLSTQLPIWSRCGEPQSLVQISYVAQLIGGRDNVHSLVQLSPDGLFRLQFRRCKN